MLGRYTTGPRGLTNSPIVRATFTTGKPSQSTGSAWSTSVAGANRSLSALTRSRTTGAVKTNRSRPRDFTAASSSSHASGIETVGYSRAPSEYTAMVVLC